MHRGVTRKKLLLTVVLIILALTTMVLTAQAGSTPLMGALRDVMAPVHNVLTKTGQGLGSVLAMPVKIYQAVRQNEDLMVRVTALEGELHRTQEVLLENERLQAVLDFQTQVAGTYETETAAVVNRSSGNLLGMITVNKGTVHGIKANMPVMTPAGLVGRVLSVSKYSSEVLLIIDPRSGVGTLVQETRVPGLVEGMSASSVQLRMAHIPGNLQVDEGQVVVTSGMDMGSLYPKGIPIGTVTRVEKEPSGLFKTALVKPFVDFHRLEEVLIVRDTRLD